MKLTATITWNNKTTSTLAATSTTKVAKTITSTVNGKITKGVFAGLSNPFEATRYHSLVIKKETWNNPDFEVSAYTTERDGSRTIMGLRHRKFPIEGVQFHPESVLTSEGKKLVGNFAKLTNQLAVIS